MLTECLTTNPASNCLLTIIEDVSGDDQGSVLILLSLLHATQALNEKSLSRQDNAKLHTTHVAINSLTALQTLPCPARSPNSSPIEHVWDVMGMRLHLLGNVDNLTRQLEQIWQEIPKGTIRVLYHSMSRGVATCIQARGGSSPYCARYFVTV
ncbi:transposable element Tc1 transposase [Trichonephila clavipes]|nr:transposable element Tc1 transposase [Trichonephila clavipes]